MGDGRLLVLDRRLLVVDCLLEVGEGDVVDSGRSFCCCSDSAFLGACGCFFVLYFLAWVFLPFCSGLELELGKGNFDDPGLWFSGGLLACFSSGITQLNLSMMG